MTAPIHAKTLFSLASELMSNYAELLLAHHEKKLSRAASPPGTFWNLPFGPITTAVRRPTPTGFLRTLFGMPLFLPLVKSPRLSLRQQKTQKPPSFRKP